MLERASLRACGLLTDRRALCLGGGLTHPITELAVAGRDPSSAPVIWEKPWIIPRWRRSSTVTPARRRPSAWGSPSSRSGPYSAVTISAAGVSLTPRLVDTQSVGDGIAILTYEPVRDAEQASDGASRQDKRAAALRQAGIRESA
jgi:hypothetical protein